MEKYDVVVLGAGPGGYVAAIRAAQLGGSVAIIEKDKFGGTCLNKGCIPTKVYLKNAEILHDIKKGKRRGIITEAPVLDPEKMLENKNKTVDRLSSGIKILLDANNVKTYNGYGKLLKNNTIAVRTDSDSEEDILNYKKLILATGSSNMLPGIPGLDETVFTSTEALELTQFPKSLCIIGGGVIGCEFATVFSEFGTKVTIIEKMPNLIPDADIDMSLLLKKNLRRKGVNILTGNTVGAIRKAESSYIIDVRDDVNDKVLNIESEKILQSIGRVPNLDGLEDIDFETDKKYIKTDESMRTSVEDIYAVGDVTGGAQLAHVASAQGTVAAEHAMGFSSTMDLSVVPGCIFTIPEIASVGMTEEQAREACEDVLVGKFPVTALGKALALGENEGLFKIISDRKTKKILGVHLFGANASDIIMEAAIVMKTGGTAEDIANTIHPHPTMSEGMFEAAHGLEKSCIHIPPEQQE